MALTKKQTEEIIAVIKKRFLGFSVEDLAALVERPYLLGKMASMLDRRDSTKITFEELKRYIKSNPIPITGVERQAIDYATIHAGQYIKGIRDEMIKETTTMSARSGTTALRAVQDGVAEAIAKRQTVSELQTNLFGMFDDKARDWQRVAHTEMNNAIQNGVYSRIRDESTEGADQLVFKRPSPDACRYCKKLHLQSDGVTPKVFKLRDLQESNFGRRAADWVPTVGSVHPWCQCQLSVIPDGYDFVKKVVKADTGEEIPDAMLERYEGETRKVAVLSFTGDTAEYTGVE